MAIEHLAKQAPHAREEIALPAGAPFGTIELDREACTLCLACVGSCPTSALLDNPAKPQLPPGLAKRWNHPPAKKGAAA